MKRAGSLVLIWGIALTLWWWMAGPGGFESVKIIWLAMVLLAVMAISSIAVLLLPVDKFKVALSSSNVMALVAIAYISLRACLSPGIGVAWLGTPTSQIAALVWLIILFTALGIINHSWQKTDQKAFGRALNITSWGLIILTIIQWHTGFNISWMTFDDPTRGRDLFGSIGSPAQLGTVSALLFALIVSRTNSLRTTSAITAAALAILTILTYSTTGLLVLTASFTIRILPSSYRRVVATAIGLTLVLICVVVITVPNRFSSLPSLEERGYIWQSALKSWPDHALFGYGPAHFSLAYDHNYPLDRLNAQTISEEQPHNLVVHALVEFGLIGLAITVLLVCCLARKYKDSDWQPAFAWLIAALFNPLSVAVLSVGLLILINLAISNQNQAHQPARPFVIASTITSIALFVAALAPIRATIALDRANGLSVRGEFVTATNVLEAALKRVPTQPILYLAAAEARTNAAIKDNIWLESDVVSNELQRSAQTSHSFVADSTRAKIADYWQQKTRKDEFNKYRQNWLAQWKSHPRASKFILN